MGNKTGSKKQKIKNAGDKFIFEDYVICDEFTSDISNTDVKFNPNLIVSEVKSDPYKVYKILKTIGEGTFGIVYLVEHKVTGKERAMKIISKMNAKNCMISNEESILNELSILRKIDHQNVVKIYEYYTDEENYYLITEYCPNGDLYNVMKNEFLSEIQIACIMYQILLAINHIHKLQIMHRDLKLENILVSKKEENGLYRVKICDFGTSHLFKDGEKEKNITGSAYYIAPEVFKQKYDFKCDLWSCGVIMYVLLTKKVPFAGKNLNEMKNNIIKKDYIREPLEKYSQNIRDLVDDLLERNHEKRLNAEKALTYELFKTFQCKELINEIKPEEIKTYIENIKKYKKRNNLVEIVLTYLIYNSDYEEIAGPLKLFNKLDKEESGKISFMDFYSGICFLSGENIYEDAARIVFHNLDTNNNNYIESEEFIKAAVDKKLYSTEKMIKFAFNFVDTKKTGLITIDNIIDLFKDSSDENKEENIKKEFEKIFNNVDLDKDGKIDFNEFSIFMKTFLEQ